MTSSFSFIQRLERRFLLADTLFGPDVSFGEGGHAAAPTASYILEYLPDGKILAVGSRQDPTYSEDLLLILTMSRVNADGTLDTSFGGDGVIDTSDDPRGGILAGSRFYVIVTGYSYADEIHAYALDGTRDTVFGGDGMIDMPSAFALQHESDEIKGRFIAAMPDGGVLLDVTHEFYDPNDYAGRPRYREIVKLKPDGSPDAAFGDNGFIVFEQNAPEGQFGIFWTTQGTIRYNTVPTGVELTRYQANGITIDTTFGNAGKVVVPADSFGYREQADGKLVFLTQLEDTEGELHLRVSRLNANGSADTSFGTGGSVEIHNEDAPDDPYNQFVTTLEVDEQGRITVVAGNRLYRFNSSGVLAGFPYNGTQPANFYQFTTDDQGRILAYTSYYNSAITRFDVHSTIERGRNDVVYGTGSDAADQVAVSASGNQINLSFNDEDATLDLADVKGFSFELRGGNNNATVSMNLPTTVTAGDGKDTITTAGGNDSINSAGGNDSINSAGGNDSINSAGGGDVITIGDGNDIVRTGKYENTTERHTITGGDGNKDIEISGGAITVTLGTGDSKIYTAYEDGKNEITIAGGNNDVRADGDGDVLVIGGNGNNTIQLGGKGKHTVTTGDGNDFFHTYTSGTIHSNGGIDVFDVEAHFDSPEPLLIFAGDGNDHLEVDLSSTYEYAVIAYGGNGNDYMWGSRGTQLFYGEAGNDTLRGGIGSDLLSGGGGNDRLFGEGGNDRLYGGAGRDIIDGGAGDDRLFGHDGHDLIYGNAGDDTISGGGSGDRIYGQAGSDHINGGGGNDRIHGGLGADTLHGSGGDDWFIAKDSTVDALVGDSGRDSSIADSNDSLTGIESTGHALPPAPQRTPITLKTLGSEVTVPFGSDADVAANGSTLIAGVDLTSGTKVLKAVRYAADGSQSGDAIIIKDTGLAKDDYNRPVNISTAVDADGDAVVLYTIRDEQGRTTMYFSRISSAGVVNEPVVVAEAIVTSAAIAMADDGRFFIGWLGQDSYDQPQSLFMRVYNADGSLLSAFTATTPVNYGKDLALAAKRDGSGAIFAYTEEEEYSTYVRYGRVSTSGAIGTPGALNRDALKQPMHTGNAAVAVLRDGSFVIGYSLGGSAFLQRYDATARARGGQLELLSFAQDPQNPIGLHSLVIDALPDGGFITGFRLYNGAKRSQTVFARRFDAAGISDDSALVAVAEHDISTSNSEVLAIGADSKGIATVLYYQSEFLPESRTFYRLRRVTTS